MEILDGCEWSNELEVTVHHFSGLSRICLCGGMTVDEPRRRYGAGFYKRQRKDEEQRVNQEKDFGPARAPRKKAIIFG